MESQRGRLLLSSPAMSDQNFDRTVVFVLEHSADGAIGVVLNRPTSARLIEVLDEWHDLAAAPPVVFQGGPVAMGSVIVVAEVPRGGPEEEFSEVLPGVGVLDVGRGRDELTVGVASLRVYSGYSGWSPGQLDEEVAGGSWLTVETLPGDPFDPEPTGLWTRALRRESGQAAMEVQGASAGWLN